MAGFIDYRLPTVAPSDAGLPAPNVQANPAMFGSVAGGTLLREAGVNLDRTSDNLGNIALSEMQIANDTRIQDLSNQYIVAQQKLLFTAPDAFYRKQGADAINAAEPTTKSLIDLKQGFIGQAANDMQRLALSRRLDAHMQDATNGIDRHVATQSIVWKDAVAKGTVQNGLNEAALNYNDPEKVKLHLDGVADIEFKRVLEQTGSEEAAKAAATNVRSQGYKSTIQLMAVNDPMRAQAFLDANRDKLDASDAVSLTGQIKDAMVHRKAQDVVNVVTATGAGISTNYNAKVPGAEGATTTSENKIGALGKYQMIPDTYTSLAQETDWGKGKSQAQVKAALLDPKDGPAKQDELQGLYNVRSVKALSGAGVPVNDLTMYTSHFLGQGAGPAILKLPDDTPLTAAMIAAHGDKKTADAVYAANPFLTKIGTVGDFKALMAQKIGAPATMAVAGSPQKPNLDAMLQAGLTLAGADPDVRSAVTNQIKADYSTKLAVYTQQKDAVEKQAFSFIDAGGSIDNMPPQLKGQLDGDAMFKVQAYEEKRVEKRRKDNAENAQKGLTDLMVVGQLTPEDVTKQKTNLPAPEYLSWQKIASGKDRLDDADTYQRLQRGLGTRDMRDDIFAEHNAGNISNETRNGLLDKNSAFLKDGAPSTPYKIGHDYVTRAMDPGLLGAGISRTSAANAIKEYDQYVAANPMREGETPEAFNKRIQSFAEDTVKRNSIINTQEMSISLPVPAHAAFNRSQMTTLPKTEAQQKIIASNLELQKKFQAGEITEDQYNADALTLMKWLDFNEKRVEPAPAKKK